MGRPLHRAVVLLSLLLALPLAAQDEAYKAQYQVNYKRFTRGDDAKVQDEAWGRLEWMRERMGGDLGPDFVQHLLREAEKERAKHPAVFAAAGLAERPAAVGGTSWVSLGPTTSAFTQNGITLTKIDSGRLRTILPDTADATGNTVYLLAAGGGLWKTTNFLATSPTWLPLTDQVGSTLSGSVAFGRSTSTLFLGAGDPFDNGLGGFMVKSVNGGTSWSSPVQLGTASKVLDIKVDTSQAQDIVLVGTNAGLYRSTDAGATYAAVSSATGYIWSLVHTSAGWLANSVASTGTGSLLLSTNNGATWSAITNAGTVYTGAGRTTLAVAAPGDSVVYAFAATKGTAPYGERSQQDLYRSSDGGQTWVALGINSKVPLHKNADNPDMNLMDTMPWYAQMVLVDPADASRNTVYLGGTVGSAKTTDGGSTWTLISNWLAQYSLPYIHADFHCAAVTSFGGIARLYFGTDGGVFTSTDGGTTWDDSKNKGLVNHLIYTLAANTSVAGSALVGMQDLGTRIRSGLTSTFNQVRGGDGFGVGWSQANNAVSLSSYVYNSIRLSTTNPVTDQSQWSSFITGLEPTGSTSGSTAGDDGTSYYFVTPLISPPATSDATGRVFFTYGNGGTGPNSKKIFQSGSSAWSTIYTAPTVGTGSGVYVRSVSHGIGVSPASLQYVAAAGSSGYLLLTTNGGTTWTPLFLGLEPTTAGLLAGWTGYNSNVAWASNNLLYVCSESPTVGATRVGKSTNGGGTWSAAATGLPDVPVSKLVVDPGDATGNTVYAATWIGVYRTTNGGTSWSLLGSGLPQDRVTDIWVAPDSSVLRVATWGRGVWEWATPTAVSITTQPASTTVAPGHTATFTVAASGNGTISYQWKRNGTAITNATNPSYTTGALTLADSGASFTCDVTGPLGTVTSNAAILTVLSLGAAGTASSSTSVAIPDAVSNSVPGTAVEIPFPISGVTGTVGEVTFSIYLTHTSVADLVITLVAPDASTVILSNNAGSNGTSGATSAAYGTSCGNYVVFSDLGTTSIDTALAPPALVGTYRPSFPLSAFNGKTANGTWKLRLQDTGPVDTGTFQCGVLSVKPFLSGPSLDLNGDGVVDLRDLLFFAKYYGTANATCDLNSDGAVNDTDLALLLAGL